MRKVKTLDKQKGEMLLRTKDLKVMTGMVVMGADCFEAMLEVVMTLALDMKAIKGMVVTRTMEKGL